MYDEVGGTAIFELLMIFPKLSGFENHDQEVANDGGVYDQNRDLGPGRPVCDFVQFRRYIHTTSKETKPFGPWPLHPETKRLDEPDSGIQQGCGCYEPELEVSYAIDSVEENDRIVTGRIEMEMSDQPRCGQVKILMDER